MSVIVDTYRKCKRKHPDRLVLFESGLMVSFILEDALEVARLLGEPLEKKSPMFGCEAVTFAKPRLQEFITRLGLLGRSLIGFKRQEKPPRKWEEMSLETAPDVSKISFANTVAIEDALDELKRGRMETDWIWFAFPRMSGAWNAPGDDGRGFRTLRESRMFLKRKALGGRMREMANILLTHTDKSADEIFGSDGAVHLKASATLFALTAKAKSDRELFGSILQRFFGGRHDAETVEAIERELLSPRGDTPRDLALTDGPNRVSVCSKN